MNPAELQIEALSTVPKGGQQVGNVPRGVRVTHLPTGLIACCESQRSQLANRTVAMSMIEWGLAEIGYKATLSERIEQQFKAAEEQSTWGYLKREES